ncbi:Cell wall protein [Apiospora arundinis]
MQTRNLLLLPFLSGLAAAQSSASGSAAPSSSAAAPSSMSSMMVSGSSTAPPTPLLLRHLATTVVNQLITVCPTATTYTFNGCVYPVTQGQTLTVTNCPCTITTNKPTLTSSLCPLAAPTSGSGPVNNNNNGGSSSSPTGGAVVPPGMNNANGTPDMPMGGSSSSRMATPSSPTAMPTSPLTAGAPDAQQKKSLAGVAIAVVGIFALGRL